ncbi:hypothetical protein C1645_872336 [Glomus cerebriforme]|uniref:BTB/POZ domain-containing protein n=1 Tax=Glomus cerebriforme TaxID=658196 RepID=A0A397TCV3_9GLOM|nr:hypothetical protein C1645_872336 [Glomus cerebriforme]
MTYIKLESEVSEDFGKLLKKETDYNVTIRIGEEPDFKEFHAHSIVLRCRSEYFDNIFSAGFVKKEDGNGKYLIEKPHISPQAFDIILKYLYTGHINFDKKTGPMLLNTIIASDELMLKNLIRITEDFIITNHQQFIQNDPIGILQIIYFRKSIINLQKVCLEIISSKPEILFNTDKFINLPDYLLEIILKRDDLNLKEIEIWEILIKWVLAQEAKQQQEFNNNHHYIPVKTLLRKFIHLIEFYEISFEDYYQKVIQYEGILPQNLKEDILRFYMITRNRQTFTMNIPRCLKSRIDSRILSRKHFVLLSNWIDKKKRDIKYNLIYRASRDGETASDFHRNCDNKGATIIVIKIKGSEKFIGGYSPIGWDSSESYKHGTDSFLFTFTTNLQIADVRYSNGNLQSIICYSKIFGFNDLFYCNCTWNGCNPSSYPKLDGIPRGMFYIDDYEVFQVIKETTSTRTSKIERGSMRNSSITINQIERKNMRNSSITINQIERKSMRNSSITINQIESEALKDNLTRINQTERETMRNSSNRVSQIEREDKDFGNEVISNENNNPIERVSSLLFGRRK